jgi:hypothetical protein
MIYEMAIEDILALPSVQHSFSQATTGEIAQGEYVGDIFHMAIAEEMRKAGINMIPIHVADARTAATEYMRWRGGSWDWDVDPDATVMGNGHHRVKIAMELGFTKMLVSDEIDETGWPDDDEDMLFTTSGERINRDDLEEDYG